MNCKNCDIPLSGRAGKKFCSATCRAQYWYRQNPKLRLDQIGYEILELDEIQEEVISGVYLLIEKNELIYIGQSKDIKKRVKQHNYNFDIVLIIIPVEEDKKSIEKELIRQYRPKNNYSNNPDKKVDSDKVIVTIYIEEEVWKEAQANVKNEKPKSSLSRKIEELLLRYLREKKEQERKV